MKPFINCDDCCDYCPATTCEERKTEHIPTYTTTQEEINRARVSYQSLTDEDMKELLRTEYAKGRYDAIMETKWKPTEEQMHVLYNNNLYMDRNLQKQQTMQDKEYVSFETAKVLKERGFNELCEVKTTKNGCTWIDYNYNDQNSKEVYSLPYVENAVNWLERNFHYYIARMPRIKDGEVVWTYQVFSAECFPNTLVPLKTFEDTPLDDIVRWCLDDSATCDGNL